MKKDEPKKVYRNRIREKVVEVVPGKGTRQEKKREPNRRDLDPWRIVSRKIGSRVMWIALLTFLFELCGFGLAVIRNGIDGTVYPVFAAVMACGLLTTTVFPRYLPLDALLMALTNFLCAVGLVVLVMVAPVRGQRQMNYYLVGLAVMMLMSWLVTGVRKLHLLTGAAMTLGILALCLPLAFGEWSNGAKNWVSLPLIGSIQPSEFVKLSVILSLAWFFSAHRTFVQMLPALLFSALCMLLLMLQRDLGTALIYYLTTLVLFYTASGNMPLTIVGMGGGVGAAMLGYQMFAHVKVRVAMWRNPWIDPTGSGYQIIQALLAIGSGGLFGVGLGQGTPERIPEYYNDFIFAVICEQFGQIFGVFLILVYVMLILHGVTIVNRSRRSFGMLLGMGVVSMLGIQTFMITAGVIKLIPLTGITMPFLSYGGSSLLSCMGMIGILHGSSSLARDEMEKSILQG